MNIRIEAYHNHARPDFGLKWTLGGTIQFRFLG